MKLKGKVKIIHDDNTITEITGELFPYEYKGHKFQLIVHESVQPWSPNVLDISELTTGCRCTSTGKPVSSSTKADVVNAMNNLLDMRGVQAFQEQIKKKQLKAWQDN